MTETEGGGTLIKIRLDCERESGARTTNFGFDEEDDDQGPLFQLNAALLGTEVFRMTDRFFNEASGRSDTLKFAKEIFLVNPVDEVCVTVAGNEVCAP